MNTQRTCLLCKSTEYSLRALVDQSLSLFLSLSAAYAAQYASLLAYNPPLLCDSNHVPVLSESVETPNSIFNLQEQTHQFVKQASAPSFSGDTSWHSLHRSTSARSALKHTVSVDFPISTDFYPKHVWWMSVNLSATCCNTYIYICVT